MPKRRLEIGRPLVFAQQVAKRLVGKLLKVFHLVVRQKIQRVPGLVIELNALAAHCRTFLAACFTGNIAPV